MKLRNRNIKPYSLVILICDPLKDGALFENASRAVKQGMIA